VQFKGSALQDKPDCSERADALAGSSPEAAGNMAIGLCVLCALQGATAWQVLSRSF